MLNRVGRWLGWIGAGAAAGAGAAQIGLLLYIMLARLTYPFDVEWLESSSLSTALRLLEGQSIYTAPNADYISPLYTPLFPLLLAGLAKVFGLSYTLGRTVSILAFAAATTLLALAVARRGARDPRRALWAVAAAGLIASSFPHAGAWHDLVRVDSLHLALVVGALYLLAHWPRSPWRHLLAGVLIGLAFLTKQTAAVFVVFSGFVVLLRNWRITPLYVATVGLVAGGTTLVLNQLTDGWFWRYIFEMHQAHPYRDVWAETGEKLLHFSPAVFALIALWLLLLPLRWLTRRRTRPVDRVAWIWLGLAAVGLFVAGLGFSTHWAYVNAYIPGLVFPALFAAVAAIDLGRWARSIRPWLGGLAAFLLGGLLAAQMLWQLYDPAPHLPTARDRRAGEALIGLLRTIDGPVLIPYHTYYAHLAGKKTAFYHMGVKDVTAAGYPFPPQIVQRLRQQYYAAVVLDYPPSYVYGFALGGYRVERRLVPAFSPRVFTGAPIRPTYLMVPRPR